MNPGRFYIPNYMTMGSAPFRGTIMNMANATPRNIGLFSKITSGIRSVNWGGLLNNANKTLNVMNQAIPLVRQAGPMVNNMKSMLRIARAFGSETNSDIKINNKVNNSNDSISTKKSDVLVEKKETQKDNYPNFFV